MSSNQARFDDDGILGIVNALKVPMEQDWIIEVRNALRPRVGALAFVILDETLAALGIEAADMTIRHLLPFLRKLKELLPEGVDREALISELARIAPMHLVRAGARAKSIQWRNS